jgi:hypothetical protein
LRATALQLLRPLDTVFVRINNNLHSIDSTSPRRYTNPASSPSLTTTLPLPLKTNIIMSEEWDSVTKIGKAVRPGGAAVRPVVARTQAEINAARRAGAVVGTEKKVRVIRFRHEPRLQQAADVHH